MNIRLNRVGRLQVCASSDNQCKSTNWQIYKYLIRITCHEKNKTEEGYIIDNMLIQGVVDTLFREGVGSCEEMVCSLGNAMAKLCEEKGVQYSQIYVRIDPLGIDDENYAYFEYSSSLDF